MRGPTDRLARSLALAGLVAAGAGAAALAAPATAAGVCTAPSKGLTFDEPGYVDTTRAGGEPIIFTHPDGTLLYGSHAGTTHFFAPATADEQVAAFGQNYKGQTYYYYSDDHGKSWNFVDRTLPPNNQVGSGFSDPEFAYDKAGNVYISEINLVNVSVSKSTDVGRSYSQQNFFANTLTDRQWTEGDEENVVYLVSNPTPNGGTFPTKPVGNSGHTLYKSIDGGATWTGGLADPGGLGDIKVDKNDGTVYEAHLADGGIVLRAFRGARADEFTPDDHMVAEGVSMLAHWPSFDLDAAGNIYMTWDESGNGDREAGIYYAYSTTKGRTWSNPVRLDTDDKTDIWPWLAVGDEGRVGVVWFEADENLPDQDAQTSGSYGWTVHAAQSLNGLGCLASTVPAFRHSVAVGEPIHTGTICQGGTTCQAMAIDRRLGDYFSVEIAGDGNMVVAYSDTRMAGPVALPGFTRQVDGPSFFGKPEPRAGGSVTKPGGAPQPAPKPSPKPRPAQPVPTQPLPATGGTLAGVGVALLAGAAVVNVVRRRRLAAPEA